MDTQFDESYYGKLPEFVELEKLFSVVIDRARKEGMSKCNPNKYEEVKKIRKIFCKLFGFKDMVFYWVPSTEANAYTVCIQALVLLGETKDFIEKRSDKGFYDSSHRSVLCMYGHTGIMSEEYGLTGAELLAIFLHEIGHNFDLSPFHELEYWIDCILTSGQFALFVNRNKTIEDYNDIRKDYNDQITARGDKLYDDQERREKEDRRMQKLFERYYNRGKLSMFIGSLYYLFNLLVYIPFAIPAQFLSMAGHKAEHFADSFATAYGYGPEIISSLEKISKFPVKYKDQSKLAYFLRDLTGCLREISLGMMEVHGTNQERCKECIKKLYDDLNSGDYPPELKPALLNEIRKLEDAYQKLLQASPEDRDKITKRWRRICDKLFSGAPNIAKWFKPNKV